MIQTFIREGGRRAALVICAVAAVSATRIATAAPMADLRSEVMAMGLDPDSMTSTADVVRRAAPKASGPIYHDNGSFNGVNGLASELNTIVSEARTADDLDVVNATANLTFVTAQLYVTPGIQQNGRLEIYANSTVPTQCNPARPFSSNPPLFVYTTVAGTRVGSGFGYDIREYDWNVTGLTLPCGKFWICPIQVGIGSGRGFFAWSQNPALYGCSAAFRSVFFGVPDWANRPFGLDFDGAYRAYGTGTGVCAGGGGGDCDLGPIEAKLDDETRFTDDDELQAATDQLQAGIDALEAKADAMQLQLDRLQATLCDIIRLITTPNGLRETTCNGVDYSWNSEHNTGGGD